MNHKKEVAKQYIEYLEKGNVQGIVDLFTTNGFVESPIYGRMNAKDFYKELLADTTKSELKLKRIFEDTATNCVALYFNYKWTMKNGETADFDVVDIINFDEQNKIEQLKIIYDTVKSRVIKQRLQADTL